MFSMRAKQAQKKDADAVFNPKEPRPKRPTAKGDDRIPRGAKFMPEYTLEELKGYVYALKEGRERSIGISWVKRKENKIMRVISGEMLKPPSTIQSWLARGHKLGLNGLAAGKSTGRPPIMDCPMAGRLREWLSKSPKDFGFKSIRWHLGMVQEKLHEEGIMASDGTVRRCMHRIRFSFRKSRPAPRKSASEEEQKEFKKETGGRIRNLALLGYIIVAFDAATCMIGGLERLLLAAQGRP